MARSGHLTAKYLTAIGNTSNPVERIYDVNTLLDQEALLPSLLKLPRAYARAEHRVVRPVVRKVWEWIERTGETTKRGSK